jgi:hypothetical protein
MKYGILRKLLRRDVLLAADFLESATAALPQGPHKFAIIISEEAKRLLAMDRYERRALSRRKFAIRAFDAARRRTHDLIVQFGGTKPKLSIFSGSRE